ncbi:MAG: Water stress and hypersensitive response domain-containing protein [Piscirickettsiaceae bacterium]|nr:MAG: Water stress and hypersensitive response domain-containing protein [Piscirickettsiaceae bacterium]
MKFLNFVLFTIISILVSACAGVTYHADPPNVSIAGIELQDAQLLEQSYALTLRIQNPNETALYINGLSYTLHLNGSEFASGVSNQHVEVPAYSEKLMIVSLVSSTFGIIQQLKALGYNPNQNFNYRLSGKVSLGTSKIGFDARKYAASVFAIPFEKTGSLNFGKLLKK